MENSELIEFLNNKFNKISKEIIDVKQDVVGIRENMATREDFSNLQTSVDGYVKKVDDYSQDETMLSHKVNRHENWLLKIADKIGIKLEY